MNYAEFLGWFIVLPLALITLKSLKEFKNNRHYLLGIVLFCLIALIYTSPWDNYLVYKGVWTYSNNVVWGKIGYVPIEEYAFMVLQTILAGLSLLIFTRNSKEEKMTWSANGLGCSFLFLIYGGYLYYTNQSIYGGLILMWAFPPLAIQWSLGSKVLVKHIRQWLTPWALLTVYLCLSDSFAIDAGIWSITHETRSGFDLGNLPVEEALFFALTNLFVMQGLFLWRKCRFEF